MEENKNLNKIENDQIIVLNNRKNMSVSGTNKIISLKPDLIQLDTNTGILLIIGNNLELIKLDNRTNQAELCGTINEIKFTSSKNKEPFFRKIFK